MLAKENRFTSKEFKDVRHFSLVRGVYLDIKRLENYKEKFSCIISAKTFKRAVDRSKVKRLVYGILQDEILERKNDKSSKNSDTKSDKKLHGALIYPKKNILVGKLEEIRKEILSNL